MLSKHEIKAEPVVKIEKLAEFDSKIEFNIKMTAKEVYEQVKKMDNSECPATIAILAPDLPPPSPPENPAKTRLARDQLLPPTPSVFLENKKHAFSPQLQEFCLKHPIAVVRQMASALKLGEFFYSRFTSYKPANSFKQIFKVNFDALDVHKYWQIIFNTIMLSDESITMTHFDLSFFVTSSYSNYFFCRYRQLILQLIKYLLNRFGIVFDKVSR